MGVPIHISNVNILLGLLDGGVDIIWFIKPVIFFSLFKATPGTGPI